MRSEKIPVSCILSRPPPRILIVEDNQPISALLIAILQLEKMIVDTARNGQEAMDCLRANEYDAVLFDLMPPRSGTEVMTFMENSNPEMLRDRFIVMTAAMGQSLREIQSKPVYHVLRKPFDLSDLRSILHDCLEATALAARESGSTVKIELRPRPGPLEVAHASVRKPWLP